jgi:tetratricopeptide (TPR) repeat protein
MVLTSPLTLDQEYKQIAIKTREKISSDPKRCEKIARDLKNRADDLFRKNDPESKYRRAFEYQTAAQILESLAANSQGARKMKLYRESGLLFHFSAHAFRKEEEYRWAEDAYMNSGSCFEKLLREANRSNSGGIEEACANAIRAYSRAKGVYGEVGDYDRSGQAYLREQVLRKNLLLKTNFWKGLLFVVWGTLTGYGESVPRWLLGYILGVLVFAITRVMLGEGLVPAFFVSFERSLLISDSQGNKVLFLMQIAYSYFILGLGLTLIVRKMQSR